MSVWQQYDALCSYYILRYCDTFSAIIDTTSDLIEHEVATSQVFVSQDRKRKHRAKARHRFASLVASNLEFVRLAPRHQIFNDCVRAPLTQEAYPLLHKELAHHKTRPHKRRSAQSLQSQRASLYKWTDRSLLEDLAKPSLLSSIV